VKWDRGEVGEEWGGYGCVGNENARKIAPKRNRFVIWHRFQKALFNFRDNIFIANMPLASNLTILQK